ncbi:MAG: hypothetical protein QOF01_818, partial [Thermomicrobiales bacterium]|nr:hypothetical protein [Thermomicrobiales bacterium]
MIDGDGDGAVAIPVFSISWWPRTFQWEASESRCETHLVATPEN